MSSLLSANHLTLRTPDHRLLLEDFTLSFSAGVTAIVGPNGVGKSSLLSVLAGRRAPASGSVTATGRLGWLEQLGSTTGDIAHGLGVAEALAIVNRITDGEGTDTDFDQADWSLQSRLETTLVRMGLQDLPLDRPLSALSGGQRARVALARAWLDAPDLLLMDEPTNNLDRDGRALVQQMLADWPGGIILVSHDRALLEGVDQIVALDGPGWSVFGGGWSEYVTARDAARERAEAEFSRAQAETRRVQRAAEDAVARQARRARQGKAQRASGSQPKMVMDAHKAKSERSGARLSNQARRQSDAAQTQLQHADAARHHKARLSVRAVAAETATGRRLLSFDSVSFGYDAQRIIEDLSFTLHGGMRLALEGPNGAGKSTVLKLAEGTLQPDLGRVQRGGGRLARLDQSVSDLDPSLSAVDALRARIPTLSRNAAYAALAQFDLRNTDADKPLSVLSGGERLRVGLAGVLGGEPPELLVLDEPTNHLDLDAIEALEQALCAYEGAILAVSHDEAFLDAIGIQARINLRLH